MYLLAASGCGGDDADSACGGSGGAGTGLEAKAEAELTESAEPAKASYIFDASLLGSSGRTFSFQIRNTVAAANAQPLKILAVRLVETDASGAPVETPAFTCLTSAGKPCTEAIWPDVVPLGMKAACIPAGAVQTQDFVIQFSPASTGGKTRKATLSIEWKNDPAWDGKVRTITFEASPGQPNLKCPGSGLIDFGNLGAGKGSKQTVTCASVGSGPVRLDRLELLTTTGAPVTVRFAGQAVKPGTPWTPPPAVEIPPGTTLALEIEMAALPSADKAGATLRITSNSVGGEVSLQILANGSGPCVKLSPADIDFGSVGVGQQKSQEIQLFGCGTEAARIIRTGITGPQAADFALSFETASFIDGKAPSKDAPLVVAPNAAESVIVRFLPAALTATSVAEVEFEDDSGVIRSVLVRGAAAKLACPTACIDAPMPSASVVPQTMVTLSSGCSAGSGGHVIDKREWSVEQPPGSAATFIPNNKQKTVSFLPNVAGTYVFRLKVVDDAGTEGCVIATQTVKVVPDNKIHVELTWTTAGDADPTDDKGADLDLHFAHPDAGNVLGQKDIDGNGEPDPWNAQCLDCFWINKAPKWDDMSDADDDPSNDLDDTDGLGPENTSMAWPPVGQKYWIGVHAWHDGGMGPSVPRVRVYLDKVLVFDKKGPPLKKADMWCVGRVRWNPDSKNPSADVEPCPGADKDGNLLTSSYPVASATKVWTCPPPM